MYVVNRKLKQLIEIAFLEIFKEISDDDESQLVPDEKGEYHASHGEDERFWGNRGAGVLLIAKDTGRILLTLRSKYVNEPGTWGIPGGKIDDESETPKSAAMREVSEELGYTGSIHMIPAHVFKAGNFRYFNFLGLVPTEFSPSVNWENVAAEWFDINHLPSPLHFGVRSLLSNSEEKIKDLVQSYQD